MNDKSSPSQTLDRRLSVFTLIGGLFLLLILLLVDHSTPEMTDADIERRIEANLEKLNPTLDKMRNDPRYR